MLKAKEIAYAVYAPAVAVIIINKAALGNRCATQFLHSLLTT